MLAKVEQEQEDTRKEYYIVTRKNVIRLERERELGRTERKKRDRKKLRNKRAQYDSDTGEKDASLQRN